MLKSDPNIRQKRRIKTILTPQILSIIRSFNYHLILIVFLILISFLVVNISRQEYVQLKGGGKTEVKTLFQADEITNFAVITPVHSPHEVPATPIVIGLISGLNTLIATIFMELKNAVTTIYLLVVVHLGLLHLWLVKVLTTLPIYREGMKAWLLPYITSPESILVNGMVFGDDEGMPEKVSHSIEIIGMQHVLAASGFNVGLILSLTRQLISRFCTPRVTAFFGLMGIAGYVALIGAPASAIRAGLMVSYSILAVTFLRRQFIAWYALLVSAVIMVLVSREYLQSISFQLSISATLGLILVEPQLNGSQTWFGSLNGLGESNNPPKGSILTVFKETAVTTVAAQSFTLPLLFYHFGQLSLLSLVANVALLWLTPLITLGGIWLVLLAGASRLLPIFSTLAYIWGIAIELICQVFLSLATWLGQAEWTLVSLPFTFPIWGILLWWAAILIWLFFGKKDVALT